MVFESLYAFLEKNFFNSLSKKILGNILFFSVLTALLFLLCYWSVDTGKALLAGQGADSEISQQFRPKLNLIFALSAALLIIALVGSVISILILKFAVVRAMKTIADTFSAEDISKNIPLPTHDEIRKLSEDYNVFVARIRDILQATRRMGLDIAIESTKVTRRVKDSTAKSTKQGELSDTIFSTSNDVNKAIDDVSKSTQNIYESTTENLGTAKASLAELHKVTDAIHVTGENVSAFFADGE